MTATELHPPISPGKVVSTDSDGTYHLNIGATIQILKGEKSERARMVYRRYVAKYRAMDGQPLTHEEREERAFNAAWNEVVREVGMAHLAR